MNKLGFWSIVLLTINLIVGLGIFLSPGTVVGMAGKYTPLVYLIAASFAGVLALSFAASAKYVNKGGAAYAYSTAAFGENIGFYVGIAQFIAGSIAWGVMATAVVKTILVISGGPSNDPVWVTVGILILMIIVFCINIFGTKLFEIVNNLSTAGKLISLGTVIIAGLIIIISTGKSHYYEIDHLVNTSHLDSSGFVMAIIAAFYAFTGFENVANGSQDMQSPEKNLPKAIPLAILIIGTTFIGLITIIMMINPEALLRTKQVVSLVGIFKSPILYNIILYGALISMFGINIATSFSIPRMLESVAEKGQLPTWFKYRNKYGFPLNAFLATAVVAVLLPMSFRFDMDSIIVLSAISRFVQFLIVPAALITFYMGRAHDDVLDSAKKNIFTDMFMPSFALFLTVFMLFRFDWKSEFSVKHHGELVLNYSAIIAMVIGYIVLPAVLFWINHRRDAKKKVAKEH